MKRFIWLFVSILISSSCLFSKENSVKPKSSPLTEAGITQANLYGIPSACVAGKVNVVTGDFVQYDVDFTIPAQNTILFERSYSSSFGQKGTLALGWNLNHFTNLITTHHPLNKFTIYLNEGQGALTKFCGDLPIKQTRIFVDSECVDEGMTNCGKGEISGKTNSKNFCFFSENKIKRFKRDHTYSIYEGDGTRHFYEKINKKDELTLVRTLFPNGNSLCYKREDREKEALNTCCELISPANDRLAEFTCKLLDDKQNKLQVTLADQRSLVYTFCKIKEFNCLSHVERPEDPPIAYSYAKKKDDEHPRITKKELPNERTLEIAYWNRKHRDNAGKKIHTGDKRINRVKFLKEPVGETSQPIQTYTFHYLLGKKGKRGSTEVLDVNKSKTVYAYDKTQRLTSISYFGQQTNFYRKEEFTWGQGQDTGNLMSHSVLDHKGSMLLQHTFSYDKFGNPLHEKIFGNLTGKGGWETHDKACTFSNNAYNLKISEKEGSKRVLYTYFPGSDKIKTKFICDGNAVKERHFYAYNRHNLLISETVDDGSGNTFEDKTQVTQCLIHFIQENDTPPAYLPMREGDNYIDENGHERHSKWVHNHYNVENRLEVQDHHDCDNSLRYRLHWVYDKYGNVISEINAAGEETVRKYDENRNLIEEQGPNKTYHIEMTYDYMNRLTKVRYCQKLCFEHLIAHPTF